MSRVVAWFSHGAPSAIATKMALAEYGDRVVIACIDTGSEHEDNSRFRADCERWYGQDVVVLHPKDYVDTWDVYERTRYLVGANGARCTVELKKRVRNAFERPDDLHVWGYATDTNDVKRARRFVEQNPGVDSWFPLLERGLSKADCLALIERAEIVLPMMYRLGYRNNNCIGCVKGGMGYWNKIRGDFPETFDRMSDVEQSLGHTVIREGGKQLPLVQLEPGRGNYAAEEPASCDLNCQTVEDEWEAPVGGAA